MSWRPPWASILIALAACALLLGFDVPAAAIFVLALVWGGTLYLATAPEPRSSGNDGKSNVGIDTMREVFEFSGSPLILTERGKIVVANSRARQALGAHIVGQDARVALRHPEAIALLNAQHGGTTTAQGLVRRRDIWQVERQTIDSHLAVIELRDRTSEGDISRAHTDFVANASHELRTPLSSIIGYAETLREGGAQGEMAGRFLETIEREAKRLQELISDLMSLSRIEAEKHDAPQDLLDFGDVVRRAAVEGAGSERMARLVTDIAAGLLIRGDAGQIEQLVRNLVDNALKYGKPDGRVAVRVQPSRARQVRLTVEDEGDGIASEHLPYLTRRFYRTDASRTRTTGGTGLGLAIVKHIVERHRGRLDIESEIGVGTCVSVRLPRVTEVSEALSAA
jgi:two-component system phosphate regulon sensor histidine kinase PhoR